MMNNTECPKDVFSHYGLYTVNSNACEQQMQHPMSSYGYSTVCSNQVQAASCSEADHINSSQTALYCGHSEVMPSMSQKMCQNQTTSNHSHYSEYEQHPSCPPLYPDHVIGTHSTVGLITNKPYASPVLQEQSTPALFFQETVPNSNNNHTHQREREHVPSGQYNDPKAGGLSAAMLVPHSMNTSYVHLQNPRDPWKMSSVEFSHTSNKETCLNLPVNNCGRDAKRIFECPKCSKVFKRGDHLKRHLLSVHDREHPYQCMECNKGFASLSNLSRHDQSSHSGSPGKGYLCARCGARFAKIEEIEQHATALHKLEDAAYMQSINKSSRTFSCDVCQKTVSSEKNLKRHIKKIHGEEALAQLTTSLQSRSSGNGEPSQQSQKILVTVSDSCGKTQSPMQHDYTKAPVRQQPAAFFQQSVNTAVVERGRVQPSLQCPGQGLQDNDLNTYLNHDDAFSRRWQQPSDRAAQQQVVRLPRMKNDQVFNSNCPADQDFASNISTKATSENEISSERTSKDVSTVSEAFSMAMKTLSEFSYDDFSYAGGEYVPSSLSVFQPNSPLLSFHYPSSVQINQTIPAVNRGSVCLLAGPPVCSTVTSNKSSVVNTDPIAPQTQVATAFQNSDTARQSQSSAMIKDKMPAAPAQYPLPDGSVPNAATLARRGRPKKLKKNANENENDRSCVQVAASNVDNNSSKFTCTVCKKTYEGIDNLMQHIETAHLSSNPHECCICQKRFAQAGNVKRHIRFVHLRERPFQCRDCDSTFDRLCYLQRHMRSHIDSTVENPYASHLNPCNCPECGKRCLTAHHLKGHLQRKHLAKNKKPSEKLMEKYGYLFGDSAVLSGLPLQSQKEINDMTTKVNNEMLSHESMYEMHARLPSNTTDLAGDLPTNVHGFNTERQLEFVQTQAIVRCNGTVSDAKSGSLSPIACFDEGKSHREKLLDDGETVTRAATGNVGKVVSNSTVSSDSGSDQVPGSGHAVRRSFKLYNDRCCFRKEKSKLLQYKCQHCPCRSFSSLALLKSHVAIVHHCTTRRHLCVLCGRSYAADILLMNHVTKRHGSKPLAPFKKRYCSSKGSRRKQQVRRKRARNFATEKYREAARFNNERGSMTDVFKREDRPGSPRGPVLDLLADSVVKSK